jgi:O-methyltransferase
MLDSVIGQGAIDAMLEVARETPAGDFVEVGVYKGGSAWHLSQIAERQRRQIYLYDTFRGIPYQGPDDKHKVGDFADTSAAAVRTAIPYANVIEGIFPASAVPMGPIAFVHLDCDQYQSILEACQYLLLLMVDGGVIWFDDAPGLPGAERAVQEVFGDRIVRTLTGQSMVICAKL